MVSIKNVEDLHIAEGKAILKVVNTTSSIIMPGAQGDKPGSFSHYEVVKLNNVESIEVKVGDYVVAANTMSAHGEFEIDGVLYIIISGYNLEGVTNKTNFIKNK